MNQNNWNVLSQPTERVIRQLSSQLNISQFTSTIVGQKGYTDPESAFQFLKPSVEQLHDPMLLHDMDKAVERIQEAAFGGEKIVIYGDYDMDGVTSTAIMIEALEVLGAEVKAYIPNRFSDGYGPNIEAYKKLIADGTQVIVTVDNGVSGQEAVEYAMSQGVDVIITDHHELPTVLPAAYAIVHPRHPEGKYPFPDLSGAGVAFKLAQALLNEGQPVEDASELPTELLDLVALGEISDMVSLTDENRVLVSLGLKQINESPRLGLEAVLKNAGKKDNEPVNAESISFKIAPRLNAVGRLGDATLALNLLLNQDSEMGSVMASEIEAINAQRQEIVEEVFGAAKQIALSDEYKNDSILIIAGKDWHQGILGIVASRLVELIQKPTIVLSLTDGLYKGSGRTFGDFDLYQFMDAFRNLYDTFGGHASALGLAISSEQLINLQNQVRLKSSKLQIKSPAVDINMMLSVKEISVETYEELKLLEPFGTGNPQPIFGLNRPKIDKVSTMGTLKQHLKLVLENNIEAVGFNHPDWVPIVMNPTGLSFAATIGLNYFRGRRTVQLLLKAIDQPAAPIENTAHKQFFAQVYKFIYSHQDVNFAKNLDSIAAQLNINKNDLNIMIQVFIELGFVHVSNGFVTIISGATQRSLTTSVTYQKYLANR